VLIAASKRGQIMAKTAEKTQHFPGSRAPKSGANISHFNHALWGNLRAATQQRVGRKGIQKTRSKLRQLQQQHQQCNINIATATARFQFIKVFPAQRNGAESKRPNGTDCAH